MLSVVVSIVAVFVLVFVIYFLSKIEIMDISPQNTNEVCETSEACSAADTIKTVDNVVKTSSSSCVADPKTPHDVVQGVALDDILHTALRAQMIITDILIKSSLNTEQRDKVHGELLRLMTLVVEQQRAIQNALAAAVVNEKKDDVAPLSSSSSADGHKEESATGKDRKQTFVEPKTPIAENHTVLIYPSTGGQQQQHPGAASDILSDIRTHIDIRRNHIRVVHARPIRNGMVVQLHSTKDVEKFVLEFRAHPVVSQRYVLKFPLKLDPRVIVFEVDEHVPEDAILKAIADLVDGDAHRVRIIKKKRTRRGNLNYVVSADGDTFRLLVASGKLPLDWAMYNVIEYDTVKQCYLCGRFGHFGKFCRWSGGVVRCGRCGDPKHVDDYGRCERPVRCINCHEKNRREPGRRPLPTDHSCHDRACPIRKQEVRKFQERCVDYESTP